MRNLGEYKEAKFGFLTALKIKKSLFGDKHISYAISL
jgi:hypothetical protein